MPTRRPAPPVALLVAAALLSGSCAPVPVDTSAPSTPPSTTPSAQDTPPPREEPFEAAAWPASGSACDTPGYAGLLGQIEAPTARTVRFTLCRPDGAFLARLAHPALSILDSAAVERLAADRSTATALAGTGPYRIDQWTPDDNVRLSRVNPDPAPGATVPTVILRWSTDPAARADALQAAAVDGIDAPTPSEVQSIATLPELSVVPRDGLATAYLAFGRGSPFGTRAVRQAIAEALDRTSLVADTFPAGSSVPTHVAPCALPLACGGQAWYEFNAPDATAALAAAKVDLARRYPLHIPDQPVPGLPDPAGVAAAVQAQLATNIGLQLTVDVLPAAGYSAAIDDGSLNGLYLGGLASTVADPGVFLAPLFGQTAGGTPARRGRKAVAQLAAAAGSADPQARASAFAAANDAIRASAPIVPLAQPGSTAVFRTDVEGAATAPLGEDPLGSMTPGDRKQVVFMQATAPDGAYCGDQPSADAYRLCGLVLQGLYGFENGSLEPVPQLARSCDPNADATVWTCRLVAGVTFHDGAAFDAGDVLASFVAQWDRTGPLRAGSNRSFAAWDELFGGTLDGRP